jgi:hypothetical protein
MSADLGDALGRRRQILGHRPTEFGDSLAHFAPNVMMRLVGRILACNAFTTNLVLGLRGAEEVGGKFGMSHPVEDMLPFLQTFTRVDVLRPFAVVEANVAVVGEDGAPL